MVGTFEGCNKLSGFIKCGQFLDNLSTVNLPGSTLLHGVTGLLDTPSNVCFYIICPRNNTRNKDSSVRNKGHTI